MIVGPPPSGALVRSVPAPTMAAGYTTGAAAGNGAEATRVPALILKERCPASRLEGWSSAELLPRLLKRPSRRRAARAPQDEAMGGARLR